MQQCDGELLVSMQQCDGELLVSMHECGRPIQAQHPADALLEVTYCRFHGEGGFKGALICYLLSTYWVYLLQILRKNVNKWNISKKISSQ